MAGRKSLSRPLIRSQKSKSSIRRQNRLVDGPDRGDIIQAEKAGIIELADLVVVNKSDVPSALKVAENNRSAFSLATKTIHPKCYWYLPRGMTELKK